MKRHALFVGVNNYEDADIRPLRYSVPDASVLADRFKRLGYKTWLLSDPTGAELKKAVIKSVKGLGFGDIFLFFFAGHGFTAQDGAHLLFCRDDMQRLLRVNAAGVKVDALEALTDGGGFHRAFLLDSCRTDWFVGMEGRGNGITRDLDVVSMPKYTSKSGSFFLLRSCDKFRPSLEFEALGHGLFTQGLLDAMDNHDVRLANCDTLFATAIRVKMENLQHANNSGVQQRPSVGECSGPVFSLFDNSFFADVARMEREITSGGGEKRDIASAVVAPIPPQEYDGVAKRPVVTVRDADLGCNLIEGKDFQIEYGNESHVGIGNILIVGKGKYSGFKPVVFQITPRSMSNVKISKISPVRYEGYPIKNIDVVVRDSGLGRTLQRGRDYEVRCENAEKPGEATVIIVGRGVYFGEKTAMFKIRPGKQKVDTPARDSTMSQMRRPCLWKWFGTHLSLKTILVVLFVSMIVGGGYYGWFIYQSKRMLAYESRRRAEESQERAVAAVAEIFAPAGWTSATNEMTMANKKFYLGKFAQAERLFSRAAVKFEKSAKDASEEAKRKAEEKRIADDKAKAKAVEDVRRKAAKAKAVEDARRKAAKAKAVEDARCKAAKAKADEDTKRKAEEKHIADEKEKVVEAKPAKTKSVEIVKPSANAKNVTSVPSVPNVTLVDSPMSDTASAPSNAPLIIGDTIAKGVSRAYMAKDTCEAYVWTPPTRVVVTGYCSCRECRGENASDTTVTGSEARHGTIAADPTIFSYGTQLNVPGYGVGLVEDTIPSVKGGSIAIWFSSHDEAKAWGTREMSVAMPPKTKRPIFR